MTIPVQSSGNSSKNSVAIVDMIPNKNSDWYTIQYEKNDRWEREIKIWVDAWVRHAELEQHVIVN